MRRSGGLAFQAEGPACVKALRQDSAWLVARTAERPVWLEQSEPRGEREKGRTGRRLTQVTQGLGWDGGGVGGGQDLGFYLPEVRALGVCGQKRAGPDPAVHWRPLVAAAGRTDCGGGALVLGREPGYQGGGDCAGPRE